MQKWSGLILLLPELDACDSKRHVQTLTIKWLLTAREYLKIIIILRSKIMIEVCETWKRCKKLGDYGDD